MMGVQPRLAQTLMSLMDVGTKLDMACFVMNVYNDCGVWIYLHSFHLSPSTVDAA